MDGVVAVERRPIEFKRRLEDLIIFSSSIVLIGSFFWIPVGLYFFYKRHCRSRKKKIAFFCTLFLLTFSPLPEIRRIKKFFLWRMFFKYFEGRVERHNFSPTSQAIYCLFPHGIFPFGVAFASLDDLNSSFFNGAKPTVASVMMHVPLIGHILRMLGAIKAKPQSITKALSDKKSLVISPGGIREIFWGYPRPGCLPNFEYVLLKNRSGFVRKALEEGVPLVPVYVFGNSKTFKRVQLPKFFESLSQRLKVSIVLFWGRFGLPVPFKVPLLFAIGGPIEIPKISNPTDEQVKVFHQGFCDALVDLFERCKFDYGWGHKTIKLV
mmetsp:Transcript_7984/g.12110  ORF Transcript_7984/g.12110 Transcript_7984/m.12110 type:complete len:323 (+) Transcript_7984:166-1134(+)